MLTRDRFSLRIGFPQISFEKKRTETFILAGLIFLGCLGFIASQSHIDQPQRGIYEEVYQQTINMNTLSFNDSPNAINETALVSLQAVYCNY